MGYIPYGSLGETVSLRVFYKEIVSGTVLAMVWLETKANWVEI